MSLTKKIAGFYSNEGVVYKPKQVSFQDLKISEEQFNSLSILEKREYMLQTQQHDTNYWTSYAARIQVILFWIGLGVLTLFVLFNLK